MDIVIKRFIEWQENCIMGHHHCQTIFDACSYAKFDELLRKTPVAEQEVDHLNAARRKFATILRSVAPKIFLRQNQSVGSDGDFLHEENANASVQ